MLGFVCAYGFALVVGAVYCCCAGGIINVFSVWTWLPGFVGFYIGLSDVYIE